MENLGTIVVMEIVPCLPVKAVHRVAAFRRICGIGTVEGDWIGGADWGTEARYFRSGIVADIYFARFKLRGNDFCAVGNSNRGDAGQPSATVCNVYTTRVASSHREAARSGTGGVVVVLARKVPRLVMPEWLLAIIWTVELTNSQ